MRVMVLQERSSCRSGCATGVHHVAGLNLSTRTNPDARVDFAARMELDIGVIYCLGIVQKGDHHCFNCFKLFQPCVKVKIKWYFISLILIHLT